ncbi:hypothetical protein DB347_19575 [Opitutaceae bacterium EW11]|nr:hypothetical protein DB347_19575 [Opitutaceae bacterium EW11]
MSRELFPVLSSEGPAADRAEKMMVYGRFVGAWAGRVVRHLPDGKTVEDSCEIHFGWVLEGRAVQDVWIVPARGNRSGGVRPGEYNLYGTTLRVFDPKNDVWHITWINPITPTHCRMTGRQIGDEIVQEYITDEGMRCQWVFTDIAPDSFHWIGRGTIDGGKTWKVQTEFFVRRTA